MRKAVLITLGVALGAGLVAHTVLAQNSPMQHQPMQHQPMQGGQTPMSHGAMHGMRHGAVTAGALTMPGQDAFGAVAEVVQMLDADPSTDWSKVNLERLRQHLIDMNEVVLRSAVKQTPVPGGLAMDITGTGRTEQAIRAMVVPHAAELDRMASFTARTETLPSGVRLTVIAKRLDDAKLVGRIRGLGFAGLITEGAHHEPHHLAMARGEALAGHRH